MSNKLTLYPIFAVATPWDDQPFNSAVLPFHLADNVRIDEVTELFNENTFRWVEKEMGRRDIQDLKGVRYAIVHKYDTQQPNRSEDDLASENLVRNVAACLRLIRPMRQRALLMQGELTRDRGFDVQHFEHPIELMEVPEVQKLFHLRNRDLDVLRDLLPAFLKAMKADYWKIRMAVQFHEGGHWQDLFWKSRYSLWMAGIESLYTTPDPDNNGRLVASERIKAFLGPSTNIYDPGDLPSYLQKPQIAVADVLDQIYKLRNYVVHGERVPDSFFVPRRQGINGDVNLVSVLIEAASFILRKSILRVLRDGLLQEFRDKSASKSYWEAFSLTRTLLLGEKSVLRVFLKRNQPLTTDEITQAINDETAAKVRPLTSGQASRFIEAAMVSGKIALTETGKYQLVP